MTTGSSWRRAADLEDFGSARKIVRQIDGKSILLCRLDAGVFAVSNVCTHLNMPMAGGRLMGGQIHCPFHGACFDVRTGAAMSGPAVTSLQCYPVEVRGKDIFLLLPG
jgi:nitrite reductase/ring-hydroxylating ferredoxin subunit